MDFDTGHFFLLLFVSSIGFVLFMYGRKQRRPPQLIAGALLLVVPYFISSNVWLSVFSAVVLFAVWGAVKLRY